MTANVRHFKTLKKIQHIFGENQFPRKHFNLDKSGKLLKAMGELPDVHYLKKFLIKNLGDTTFQEAFQKSGLHINVAVAPYDASQDSRIMNSFTAPDLLVWSAVLASCAVPEFSSHQYV